MVKRCCYGTCNTDSRYKDRVENVVFFPFPKPTKDVGKCLRWIKLCGRPHQQLNVNKLKNHGTAKHFYVCSKNTAVSWENIPVSPSELLGVILRACSGSARCPDDPRLLKQQDALKTSESVSVCGLR
ncbi:hypothetical protein N1851_013319 [Merluccius polli]|uniref:THAP-type domain-containing protein n=1 Tax=Merluccius polli TaxID=89951 RepID=A0AA47MVC1_MERPO|nr:hypothetical protein N1851_013319 [Merluccius polli]